MPLADGSFGLCRIIRATTEDTRAPLPPCVLVATSSWRGSTTPDLQDPRLREILRLTHHAWAGQLDLHFTSDPPPPEYRFLGEIPLDDDDRAIDSTSFGPWSSAIQVLAQWRWDHDREALLREEAEEAKRAAEETRSAEERGAKRRAELTWEKLRAKTRFGEWADHLDEAIVASARKLFVDAVDNLANVPPQGGKRKARAAVRDLVEGFNRLDVEHGRFIETVEREEICAELDELLFLARLPEDLADVWRDW